MGEVLRLWSSLGDVLKYAIGFTFVTIKTAKFEFVTVIYHYVLILDYFSTLCPTEGILVTFPKAIKMFFVKLSENVIALVMKKATIALYIVIVLFYYLTTTYTVRILYWLFQMGGGILAPPIRGILWVEYIPMCVRVGGHIKWIYI